MTYCHKSNQTNYPFILPDLPFAKDAFKPYFSEETFDYHHGKHHQAYVTNLNNLIDNKKELAKKSLEEIILESSKDASLGGIFNNAAQVWNHTFFWHSIKPKAGGMPGDEMLEHVNKDFGNFEKFVVEFKQAAVTQFGSGWAWLVFYENKLQIVKTANAETPITRGMQPLFACDVWEHAYYIDYRNKRPDYVDIFINHLINWDFATENLHKAKSREIN